MKPGKLIIFSAPSGAGKTTLVHRILKNLGDQLAFSISACTREKRPDEIDGKDYYFISPNDFKEKIRNHEFVEWEEVYQGQFYGTLKSELERIWNSGKNVIFDIDVHGGINLKQQFTKQAFALFVMPPSIEVLESRLRQRQTETAENIAKRVAKATEELRMANRFDKIIINENLEVATSEAQKLVSEFLMK